MKMVWASICLAVFTGYLAGYAKIRWDCNEVTRTVSIVPSYISTGPKPKLLYYAYKPMFFLEKKYNGKTFTWSSRAMADL